MSSQQLMLVWPNDHRPTLARRELAIEVVNVSALPWLPAEGDDFYVAGFLLAPGVTPGTRAGGDFAFVAGSEPAVPLQPGQRRRVAVHLAQEAWDQAAAGTHRVQALLISLDLRSAENAPLERLPDRTDAGAAERALIPPGSAAAKRGERLIFDRVLTATESAAVLDEILLLCTATGFHATGVAQNSGQVTAHHIEVDLTAEEWFLYDPRSRASYRYHDHTVTAPHDEFPTHSEFGEFVPDQALRLAFPRKLFVWGRPGDDYRPILVQRLGHHSILITIENRDDAAARGTIIVNTELGLIEKMCRTTEAVLLTNVQPGLPVERHTPTDLGDLSYQTPSY
ncbi:hypothetical protein E3T55_04375 [Cryobacterium frigoriphilum]|uniref:Uncharacterized protein n=1 Tax=Cryobacterium frigoriphilum TaxID=1259150 RepID=A0A4R9A7Y0_9MICO|nr:hypothetical protein [Cryobacterium frigoriphilum]TFD53935.1 hypothetical protein E3T55_04375 [Cryobacterium frigoriphilum]